MATVLDTNQGKLWSVILKTNYALSLTHKISLYTSVGNLAAAKHVLIIDALL